MCKYLRCCWAGFIFFSVACGSSNSSDGTGDVQAIGGGGNLYVRTGGAAAVGNGIGGADEVGGAGVVGGSVSNTGGVPATGGRRSIPAIGGTTSIGTAVCDGPTICGQVFDANGDLYDCGFVNCPQVLCGANTPNQCPPACVNKATCSSTDCGEISDGCGGVIDCGYANCPQGVCGQQAPNQCPTTCGTLATCSSTDCGLKPDGCGGVIDCGYTNCLQSVCGQQAPNQCPPACSSKITCQSAGNKDCGFISDGCGGLIDCGSNNCPQAFCGLIVPNQCPSACITKTTCQSAGNKDCGFISDGCGGVIDCGSNNCPQALCGLTVPNQCPSACNNKTTCQSAGNKDCGFISDGCGGVIDCGTCTSPLCCGCGSTTSPGEPNKCGGGTSANGSGLPQACIAGQQGCLCDSVGGCAPGLTCNKTATPTVCCSGTNCNLPANTPAVSTCGGAAAAHCTPGITIPTASGTSDNCGYPAASFNESTIICGITASGGGAAPGQVQAFFNDEMSMTLGCIQNGYTVTPMASNPAFAYYPNTGDPTCVDLNGRPLRPSLFITDITNDPNCRSGDQQQGGRPFDPVAIFGTWKAATNGTPDANPSAFNYWNLGTNADPVPASVSAQCPCVPPPAGVALPDPAGFGGGNLAAYNNCPGTSRLAKGFSTEARYEAAFVAGHSYRLQIIGHDGDQTQGGDSGEACVTFCAEGDIACTPQKCTTGMCGTIGDGCGGTIDCGDCACVPQKCTTSTCGKVGDGCGGTLDCAPCTCVPLKCTGNMCGKVGDGCGGTIDCGPCCVPQTCGANMCGIAPDGCGGTIDCGSCCVPQKCSTSVCGTFPDGCGGTLDCGPCCVPWTCDDYCPPDIDGKQLCSSTNDGVRYILPCQKPDGCSSVLNCFCLIG